MHIIELFFHRKRLKEVGKSDNYHIKQDKVNANGVFEIHLLVSCLSFSNNLFGMIRVNIRESEHYETFEIS